MLQMDLIHRWPRFNYLSPFEFPWQLDLVRGLSLALGKLFVGPRLHKIHGICFRFELLGSSGQPTTSAGWLTFLAREWVGGSCASCDKLDLPCSWFGVPIPCLIPLWIGKAWPVHRMCCSGLGRKTNRLSAFLWQWQAVGRGWERALRPLDLSGLFEWFQNGCGLGKGAA